MSQDELLAMLTIGGSLVFTVVIMVAAFVIGLVVFMAMMIACNYPLYRMAKNAGYKHPIFAFIPCACNYLMVMLSKEEFNLFNWIVIKERKKAAWICVAFTSVPLLLIVALLLILVGMLFPPLLVIGLLLYFGLFALCSLASIPIYFLLWRTYFDLYTTYGLGEQAMLFSILSLFVPFVAVVLLYMNMNNAPNYGMGNFYAD